MGMLVYSGEWYLADGMAGTGGSGPYRSSYDTTGCG